MKESIKLGKDKEFQAIQCMALSLYTQKICLKNNFQELFSIKYEDVELFDASKMGPHEKGILYALKL